MFFSELKVTPEMIVRFRDEIGLFLKDFGCQSGQINKTMLIFEELFMPIYDRNSRKKVLAECTI